MLRTFPGRILWAVEPKDHTGNAAAQKWVKLDKDQKMIIAIQTGAWAGGTAAVTVEQATTSTGTSAKAVAFATKWDDVTTSGTLAEAAVTSNTFDLGAANKIHLIEINASDLDMNNDFAYVSVAIATPGTNADFYGVLYVLPEPRYSY